METKEFAQRIFLVMLANIPTSENLEDQVDLVKNAIATAATFDVIYEDPRMNFAEIKKAVLSAHDNWNENIQAHLSAQQPQQ